MLFKWLKKRRRWKLMAEPFPEKWLEILEQNVHHYSHLSSDQQARLRDDMRIFIGEKYWEGCGGLEMSDEIKVKGIRYFDVDALSDAERPRGINEGVAIDFGGIRFRAAEIKGFTRVGYYFFN